MRPPAERTALLVTDLQNDFFPGGALSVAGAETVVDPINKLVRRFHELDRPIIFTRDWHPPGHVSFAARGGPWPEHCVRETRGADFVPGLAVPPDAWILDKATETDREAYSAFAGTSLASDLRGRGIESLVIAGVATEYCVKETVLDALAAGFAVTVVSDAVRGVEAVAGDSHRALEAMRRAGATIVSARGSTVESFEGHHA